MRNDFAFTAGIHEICDIRVQMSPTVDLNQGQVVLFKMTYDPAGGGGAGSMSFSIGTVTNSMNLPSSFKANTLPFDRFGLMTVGVAGGGPSFNYFDDLSFTTERPPLRGDFNGDGVHTAADLDLLS